jgi:hypothetical protein
VAQIGANPWFFTNADQASTFALTSIVNQGESLLVTSAAHGIAVGSFGVAVSLQGSGIGAYAGGYRTITVPSATTLLLQNQMKNRGLANTGATGNLLTPVAYLGGSVRAEQIYWQPSVAADTLLLTDVFGNTIWNPKTTQGATGGSFGPYAYGKIYWIANGLVINTLPAANTVQITIN